MLPTNGGVSTPCHFDATQSITQLQSSAITIFLTKLGYAQMFPWVIAYVSTNQGSIEFLHLGHKDLQKCL